MKPEFGENYKFRWKDLGDVKMGRPNLGLMVPVGVYRLAQYTMRETIAQHYGDETASQILREAGWVAGREFCLNQLNRDQDLISFVDQLQEILKNEKVGILRLESADLEKLEFTMTVSEDLDCSGLPVYGKTVCEYDEGFIAGILYTYTGKNFSAVEIDCWATGDRTCRFAVNVVPA